MRKILKLIYKTVKWTFLVFCVFILSLFFRVQEIPGSWVNSVLKRYMPESVSVEVDSLGFGFMHGVSVKNLRICDKTKPIEDELLVYARTIRVSPIRRVIEADELTYTRLPDSYYFYEPVERNQRVEVEIPNIERFSLVLTHPHILGIRAERATADVHAKDSCISVDHINLDWPDKDEPMSLKGHCRVDFKNQVVSGRVDGFAKQHNIRPLLVALDVPVSLPYMDGFTEIPEKIAANCSWNVDLITSDLNLEVGIDTAMGKYNDVPMKAAKGTLKINVFTRGTSLNYDVELSPLVGSGPKEEPLAGQIVIHGLNGTNTVEIVAKSGLPVRDLLKIGELDCEFVNPEVVGDSACDIYFHFPRAMRDIRDMDGRGHLELRNGEILKLAGLMGLLDAIHDYVPGVSKMTDVTQASADYVVENGCIKTDNIVIEGRVFSIKMWGVFDAFNNTIDMTARVQFSRSDSMLAPIIHTVMLPVTKTLLEFRITGSLEDARWEYISVFDRAMEAVK